MATDTQGDTPRFEDVDWEEVGGRDLRVSLRTATFLVLFCALVALYCYDVYVLPADTPTLLIVRGDTWTDNVVWDVSRLDWLSMFVGVVAVSYAVVPALADPSKLRDAWEAYPKDALSLVALGYVVVFVAVGLLGPVLLDQPTLQFDQARQPPVYVEVPTKYINVCLGPTEGGCQGTWRTPLGTTTAGEDMVNWLTYGTRTALQFALVSAVLMVPIATLVGTTAAYLGGRWDAVLMRYVEVQDSVPTVIVYFLLVIFVGPTLFMLVVAYGLFNWGDLARLVRGEALSIKEEQFVTAARSAGAGPVGIVRHHLVPNLSSTVVANLGMTIPKLVLIEALFSFLKLSGDKSYSWGQLIQRGLFEGGASGTIVSMSNLEGLWWIPVLPAVAISLTVLLFFVFGDALQTAVDPRTR